jgi:hypothetical protein
MAFEPSLASKLASYKKAIDGFKKDIDVAAAQVGVAAASIAMQSLHIMARVDSPFSKSMRSITSYAGKTGKDAAKQFAKEFSQGVRDLSKSNHSVAGMFNQLDARAEKLAKRKAGTFFGWGEAEDAQLAGDKARAKIDKQMGLNNRLKKTIGNRSTKTTKEIKTLQGTRKKINQQLRRKTLTPQERATFRRQKNSVDGQINAKKNYIKSLTEQAEKIDDTNNELQVLAASTKTLGAQFKATQFAEKKQDFIDKGFGPVKKMIQFGSGLISGLKILMSPIALLAGALMLLGGAAMKLKEDFFKAAAVFREDGLTGSQVLQQIEKSQGLRRDLTMRGTVTSPEEIAQHMTAMQTDMADLNAPMELMERAAFLAQNFKLSSTEAAKYVGDLYRLSGSSTSAVIKNSQYIQQLAIKNGMSTAQIFRMMAENSDKLAKSGNMSAEAYARAAIKAERIGVSMGSISSLADRLVSDFEGALKTQAEMQTMFPGADMSEVMYASQFGTEEQVLDSVTNMVKGLGVDFKNLPRSFKLALERSTGMSSLEIGKMMGVELKELVDPVTAADITRQEQMLNTGIDTNGKLDAILGRMGDVVTGLLPLGGLFKFFTGKDYFVKQITKTNDIKIGADIVDSFKPKMENEAGQKINNKFAKVSSLSSPLFNDQKNKLFTDVQGTAMTATSDPVFSSMAGAAAGFAASQNPANTPRSKTLATENNKNTDMAETNRLLSELLKHTKDGKVINMDGRKVGETIASSFNRG